MPKAFSISRSMIKFKVSFVIAKKERKSGGPEVQKLPSVKIIESPKAMSISRSEILREKKAEVEKLPSVKVLESVS